MKTNVVMTRDFYGSEISQRTKDGFFNATELLKRFNLLTKRERRFKDFWENKNTQEFCYALKNELIINRDNSAQLDIVNTTRGVKGSTWMHPYLYVKFAMWLSPELEVKIIKWVYDNLIEYRSLAGDYYNEMCKAIADRYSDFYGKKADPLVFVHEAHFLNQLVFGNPNGNQRNKATEPQLELMNKLQLANIKLINSGIGKETRRNMLRNFANLYE